MAEYTQNYNLKKPAEEDFYNVKDFNDNADIIDEALKAHDDALDNHTAQLAETTKNIDNGIINVKYPPIPLIGAKGDNITDDTVAIQNIANYAATLGDYPTLLFPHSSGYLTTDTITIGSQINVIMESPIMYDGTQD